MKTKLLTAVMIAISGAALSASATAQEPSEPAPDPVQRIRLFESPSPSDRPDPGYSESDVRRSRMTVAEMRQARAMYRSRQRVARLEYNLWMGNEPLRPNWNSVPMMSSRYSRPRVVVPVYIYRR